MSKEQGSVGSLSFTVTDTSSPKQSSEPIKRPVRGDVGKLKKPAPRAKVPFEKGYSQMDWLKLTQTHPDLAGTYRTTFDTKISSHFQYCFCFVGLVSSSCFVGSEILLPAWVLPKGRTIATACFLMYLAFFVVVVWGVAISPFLSHIEHIVAVIMLMLLDCLCTFFFLI